MYARECLMFRTNLKIIQKETLAKAGGSRKRYRVDPT
jgi:hypothetical protein